MKIDSSYKPSPSSPAPKVASAPTAATKAQEAVSLSPLAGSLAAAEQAPMNTAKIQEIKLAIAEGRFKINPEAIADRLIESARDLVSRDSRQRQA